MQFNCDEDSGRSSCSAASLGISPIMDYRSIERGGSNEYTRLQSRTHDIGTNTKLRVNSRPRSFVELLKSPDEKDPFPSCRLPIKNQKKAVFNLFGSPGRGGLSNAQSTLDIASSTHIEPVIQHIALSMNSLGHNTNIDKQSQSHFRRGKPVQRAASRLYKADSGFKGKDTCVGPEFIVRASQTIKEINIALPTCSVKNVVTVVLLNGQRVKVTCDPSMVTAGQLFEAIVHSEKYEHNFMLGIAVLLSGDFVFLPDDYKIKKIAPESWHKIVNKKGSLEENKLTVFLRIKFFLPTNIAKNIQGGEWRHRVYLQLRRATVEGQLTSTIHDLIVLAGYALHIEFGEFSYKQHGTADYFLLEHYLPESVITNDMLEVKLKMKRAHESRRGLEKNKAIINFITLAQTFRDYGSHFYSTVWATRDGFCRDIWLSIGPRGITLYSRKSIISANVENCPKRIVLQCLPWHHIHTFYYNKKNLYIIPNTFSGLSKVGVKYKLKMADNKSYFTFWLASLHHRLYLKLYAKDDFINYLSDELSCPLNIDASPKKIECSNYEDSYNLAVRNPVRIRKPVRRKFKVDIFSEKYKQNKENEKPTTEELLKKILTHEDSPKSASMSNTPGNSSNDGLSSSESCSLPRRHGVKMGTRVFNGIKTSKHKLPINKTYNECVRSNNELNSQSDSDDFSLEQKKECIVNSMKLLPERQYNTDTGPTAYVLESPKVYPDAFNYNAANESYFNTSIFEKLDHMGCVQGERVFVTAEIERGPLNALGLQVAEGSDGNVYIKSITPGGPADICKKLLPGDQIISVNGQTLLYMKYDKALKILQTAPQKVELIVLQIAQRNNAEEKESSITNLNINLGQSLGSTVDADIDDELLNEEALRTIYALIKLTKDKVINRLKDHSSHNYNVGNLQKSYSENIVYEGPNTSHYSSQEITPSKLSTEKFNTWRGPLPNCKSKRRPLSLSIPSEMSTDFLNENSEILKKSSLKSIQSSLSSLDMLPKSTTSKNVALPRNFGLSRRWLGPVKYPVTPCKNDNTSDKQCAIAEEKVLTKHFVYGAGDSEDDQIFL